MSAAIEPNPLPTRVLLCGPDSAPVLIAAQRAVCCRAHWVLVVLVVERGQADLHLDLRPAGVDSWTPPLRRPVEALLADHFRSGAALRAVPVWGRHGLRLPGLDRDCAERLARNLADVLHEALTAQDLAA